MPPAATGSILKVMVLDSDGITIDAQTGDTIQVGSDVSASGGTAASTDVVATLHLIAADATQWIALSGLGTWTVT